MSKAKERINLKKIQDKFMDQSHNFYLAGLGVYATVGDGSTRLYNKAKATGKDFVEKGKKIEKGIKRNEKTFVNRLDTSFNKSKNFVGERIVTLRNTIIEPFGVTSQAEVVELSEKVDKLTEIVVVLAQKNGLRSQNSYKSKSQNELIGNTRVVTV